MKETILEVCVDSNEAVMAESILNSLRLFGCAVRVANLSDCDYVVSDRCGIERKDVRDFAASLMDGRLFDQAKKLSEGYEKPLMILQGSFSGISRHTRISPNSLWGAISSLVLDFRIPIVPTHDELSTAQLICRLAYHEQAREERPLQLRRDKKRASLEEEQLYILSGLPNIGRSLAEELLRHFETPIQVLDEFSQAEIHTSESGKTKRLIGPLKEVKGVGPVIAEKARSVLNSSCKQTKQT